MIFNTPFPLVILDFLFTYISAVANCLPWGSNQKSMSFWVLVGFSNSHSQLWWYKLREVDFEYPIYPALYIRNIASTAFTIPFNNYAWQRHQAQWVALVCTISVTIKIGWIGILFVTSLKKNFSTLKISSGDILEEKKDAFRT